jgi:hypothetical protein
MHLRLHGVAGLSLCAQPCCKDFPRTSPTLQRSIACDTRKRNPTATLRGPAAMMRRRPSFRPPTDQVTPYSAICHPMQPYGATWVSAAVGRPNSIGRHPVAVGCTCSLDPRTLGESISSLLYVARLQSSESTPPNLPRPSQQPPDPPSNLPTSSLQSCTVPSFPCSLNVILHSPLPLPSHSRATSLPLPSLSRATSLPLPSLSPTIAQKPDSDHTRVRTHGRIRVCTRVCACVCVCVCACVCACACVRV